MRGSDSAAAAFGPEDASRLAFISDAGFLVDGRLGYYEVLTIEAEEEVSRIGVFDRSDASVVWLEAGASNPRWAAPSPDARHLAFVADVRGVAQLHIANIDRGTTERLTDLRQGVGGAPVWSPTGEAIAFSAAPRPRRHRTQPYRVSRPTIAFEGIGTIDDAILDLFVVDVARGVVKQVTDDNARNQEPRWSPHGKSLLFLRSFPPNEEWTAKPSALVAHVESTQAIEVVGQWGAVLSADWTGDGESVVFLGKRAVAGIADAYFQRNDLWRVPASGGSPTCLTTALPAGVGYWLEFDHPTWSGPLHTRLCVERAEEVAYVSAQHGRDVGICRVRFSSPQGAAIRFVPTDEDRSSFLADVDATDGSVLYVGSSINEPPELFLASDGAQRQITRLNAAITASRSWPRVEKLTVEAPDGAGLDGWALLPAGTPPFPTVLAVHGGPCNAFGSVFYIDHQLLVGAGFAVVMSNFRGSGGYGDEFHQALEGRWGEVGERDHLATVNHVVALGIADPQRLGVYGLSHGGFATCWLAGKTDRFRAAVAENPAVDFDLLEATMDAAWWLPLELRRASRGVGGYTDLSATQHAAACSTPLLFVVGEADLRCPPSQSELYFRILKQTGGVTEMLRLPDSNHLGSWEGPVSGRVAQNWALVDWFSRHLGSGDQESLH